PDSVAFIMGLTHKDISTTKGKYKDWGILGLGQLPGPSCVVSTFRLGRKARNKRHIRQRLARVARHELGHNLGLPHCPAEACFMRDAEGKLATVDEEGDLLCGASRAKVKWAVK
ncbi:MAG: hypothetical protein AAF570_16820, partial [Bacteroidota bacterium]